jgi:hypothetical protein
MLLTDESSGFNHDDAWGHRAGEPNKAVICSLALARLRTDIKGDLAGSNVVGMAQKLLLFWRKPARRCWWEGVELNDVDGVPGKLKVWIRRVWTLEMVSDPRQDCLLVVLILCAERDRSTVIPVRKDVKQSGPALNSGVCSLKSEWARLNKNWEHHWFVVLHGSDYGATCTRCTAWESEHGIQHWHGVCLCRISVVWSCTPVEVQT